ncbi:MAG: methyltransferase, partial [Bacteroidota bacterium]|nr:methyltransferase [Bacteroidota bacterium]
MDKRIEEYCENMHSNKDERLQRLIRQTHLQFVKPNMVSGSWQGELLMMICKMLSPKRILEIGTFSGYATLCFAFASRDD